MLFRSLDGDSPLRARLLAGSGLLVLPVLAFLALDQRPGQAFDNQYLNELSENGPYQFFHAFRSEEHTSELQSLMRISFAVFCLKTKNTIKVPSLQSEYQ